MRIFFLPSI